MALLYIEERDHDTPDYEHANEVIPEGDLLAREPGGGVVRADAGDYDRIDGIALHLEAGDHIAAHEYDYNAGIDDFKYQPASDKVSTDFLPDVDDMVPVSGFGDSDHIRPRTIEDSGATAPSVGHWDVVGVVDSSVGDAPAGPEGQIVEEGYTNGATTFNRSNDNFVALGRADVLKDKDVDTVTSFDERVRVIRDKSL